MPEPILREPPKEFISLDDIDNILPEPERQRDVIWRLAGVGVTSSGKERLKDVTLEVRSGVTAVLGVSGAGKSSLLNILAGYEAPTAGTVEKCFESGARLPVFWSPQGDGLWPHLTVWQHMQAVAGNDFDGACATEMLAAFGMDGLAGKYPDRMSSGERERLSVCRALFSGAEVVVLDEPLANVDACRAPGYWDYIQDYSREKKISLVMATHSREQAVNIADDVICVRDGQILFCGEMRQLYDSPPSLEEARLLGKCNYFSARDCKTFLHKQTMDGMLLRPERLCLVPGNAEKDLQIVSFRRRTPYVEVDVQSALDGKVKRAVCMPSGVTPREGMAVALRLIGCMLLCLFSLFAGGCDDKDKKLPVSKIEHWMIPNEGAMLPSPRSVCMDKHGRLYALDTIGRILVYSESGELLKSWSMPDVALGRPEGIVVKNDGTVVVCDTHYNRIIMYDADGKMLKKFGSYGKGDGQFIYPVAITLDAAENIYIAEYGTNDRVQKFTSDGEFIMAFGTFGTGEKDFQRPSGLVWRKGLLYVADAINNNIKIYTDKGMFVSVLGGDKGLALEFPYDMALADDKIFIVEYGAGRVTCVDFEGNVLGRFGSTGMGRGQFSTPWGMTASAGGDLFVADTGNRRIVRLGR